MKGGPNGIIDPLAARGGARFGEKGSGARRAGRASFIASWYV